ncbi:hypothetical protein [Facklamia sp. 7083-14-GEN3]|uniref:hypothetical protein n=1 Tax=Facklamia sp. 7083-14-GEN3 TaxID=2973478 RepID=UPI00215B8296|nr:hypothetical protein [Facklamia sp. 7083-14-GEN3]MCR8969920.1 hypothetical protein [Facklamia sp. 7083-14-GEN3]
MNQYIPNYPKESSYYPKNFRLLFASPLKISFEAVLQLEKKMISCLKHHPLALLFFMIIGMPLCILLSVAAATSIFSLFYMFIFSLI